METQYLVCFMLNGSSRTMGITADISNINSAEKNHDIITEVIRERILEIVHMEADVLRDFVIYSIAPIIPS